MQFTKKLRDGLRSGEITTSIRIWKSPRVKVGGRYAMEGGFVEVTSIHEISLSDITDSMAKKSGFLGKVDLLKTARHGEGDHIYFVEFVFHES